MGLDIAFNRKAALDAGLVVFTDRIGTDESIAQAMSENDDQSYIDYLRNDREFVQVPNASYSTENGGADTDIVVRANRWGSTYAPLTEWLKANNINWSEF